MYSRSDSDDRDDDDDDDESESDDDDDEDSGLSSDEDLIDGDESEGGLKRESRQFKRKHNSIFK